MDPAAELHGTGRKGQPLAQSNLAKRTALETGRPEGDPVETTLIKTTFAVERLRKACGLPAAEVASSKPSTMPDI
jgi:hypothetical protein